ncbi:MAG: nucleotidyltransferase domain-containing protein [Elusimicrobia bacterium]|nr:nucleotidyltransferase domain-containing protein [Elusimicrobiota bacterium]
MTTKIIRLSGNQKKAIEKTCAQVLTKWGSVKVWLFGSRAKANAKGGDIDLLVSLSRSPANVVELKIELIQAIRNSLGEQKIDVVIEHPGAAKTAFYELAKQEGVLLWQSR